MNIGQVAVLSHNMEKKFKLVKADKEIRTPDGKLLKQLVALKDFDTVQAGDRGGYIQSSKNLTQEGNCWVYDNAMVFGNAKVSNDAKIYGNSKVFGNAEVFGWVHITGNSFIHEHATVCGKAIISSSTVDGGGLVGGDAVINDGSKVSGDAIVIGGYHSEDEYDTGLVRD